MEDNKYNVNNIFEKNGLTFNEIITSFLVSFLDKEFNLYEKHDTINNDLILNL